jgi:phosphoglycolate phosphatase-like HAD superfamily hydrolase
MTPVPARPRALLLDFDGVILQSAALKTRAFAELYDDADAPTHAAIVDYADAQGGLTRRDKFAHIERTFFAREPSAGDLDRLTAAFRARVFDAVLASDFVPGAERLLRLAQGKIALHVVSGTPHDELVEIVERRGLARWFASVDGAPPGKRETFARILAERGYRADEALAVGDALTEFEAARALAIPFLAVVPPGAVDRFPADLPHVPTLEPVAALLGLA